MFDTASVDESREGETFWFDLRNFLLMEIHSGLFALLFFIVLVLSQSFTCFMPRYDFIFLCALLIQSFLIVFKFETMSEVRAIALFHILGFLLEVFKTNPNIGSWSYPEFGHTKFFGVPLYAGFMYAAVGSYMMRAWKDFALVLVRPPSRYVAILLASLVYVNFFTHHFLPDFRYLLIALILIVFRWTSIRFLAFGRVRSLYFAVVFLCFGIVIWIAENMATYLGAWRYPHQATMWHIVHMQKIVAWALLALISFMIVASRDKAWKSYP